jgi:hypothetical protein
MNVGGMETAAVYLSPQAITPLSPSKEPIALALAARTDLSKSDGAGISKAADKNVNAVDAATKAGLNAHEKHRTPALSDQSTAGVAFAGKVDVYA